MSDGNRKSPRNQRDDGEGRNRRDGREQGPSAAEKVLTGISVVFTVLLFGYVAWQAVQPPGTAHPEVEVAATEQLSNGNVVVHVELTNPGDKGLISATVEAGCDQPPPDTTLEYVPAGGREQGVLVCPPGTTRPNASISAWVPA